MRQLIVMPGYENDIGTIKNTIGVDSKDGRSGR